MVWLGRIKQFMHRQVMHDGLFLRPWALSIHLKYKDNCIDTCLDPIYLWRKPLPMPIFDSRTTFFLKVLPCNIRRLPSRRIPISRSDLQIAEYTKIYKWFVIMSIECTSMRNNCQIRYLYCLRTTENSRKHTTKRGPLGPSWISILYKFPPWVRTAW